MHEYNKPIPAKYTPPGRGFRAGAAELLFAEDGYELGGSGPDGTDCSGSLSYALTRTGWPLRMTADGFMRNVFTLSYPDDWPIVKDPAPSALFWISRFGFESSLGYSRDPGEAVHCAPHIGNWVFVDAWWRHDVVDAIPLAGILNRYDHDSMYPVMRYASHDAMRLHAGVGRAQIDPKAFTF